MDIIDKIVPINVNADECFKPPKNWVDPVKPPLEKCQCGKWIEPKYETPLFWNKRLTLGTGRWYFGMKCQKCLKIELEAQKKKDEIIRKKQEIEDREKQHQKRIQRSGLYPKHLKMEFDNLTIQNDDIIKLCKQFCITPDFNLFLWGKSGIGKTHLLSAVANEMLKTRQVYFWRTPDFLNEIRKTTLEYDSSEADEWLKELAQINAPITIDDIGAEKVTDFVLEKFYNFFDFCELYDKKGIIITSNLNLDELKAKLGDRIPSRIAGICKIKEVKGEDFRLKRYGEKKNV